MFNVTRPQPAPLSLALKKSYNDPDVIKALRTMFHSKCYLCEQDSVSNPEVDHFVPHRKVDSLKYGWDNLYYICRRCNGIKSNTHINLLDCVSVANISDEIEHYAGNAYVGEIIIKASQVSPSQQTLNTIELLMECYNSENTSLREISKESLLEKLLFHLGEFIPLRDVLAKMLSTPEQISHAKSTLALMCRDDYPFSIFWKWHIIKDIKLKQRYPNLRQELGF
ncbi:HNH endonuclease [Pantoea stewartii]|uniref:HNH endonuclease n=1 Tax=Pantoea stewartii TaxID=66269 RepID=UPI001623C84B|nr:HNH endonuclease [Pantoea stewartii]MBC0855172.1 HNH endonuclease [Pantoea stewartii]